MKYKGYELEHDKQRFLGSKEKIREKLGFDRHNCEECGNNYRLPNSVYEPRERICFTCESRLRKLAILGVIKTDE